MAVPVMATLTVPNANIAVVAAGVFAVLGLLRLARRPDLGHTVRTFNPAAQASKLYQRTPVLGQMRKSNEFDLNSRIAVGLHSTGRIAQGTGTLPGIDVLKDVRRIDCEVGIGQVLGKGVQGTCSRAALGGVVDDLERPPNMRPG